MQIVLAVSSSKFTGAAAVAELWCRSLRAVGFEANLVFVRGGNLERRLADKPWAQGLLFKERRASHIRHNLAVLRLYSEQSDVVITMLPHDHFEAVFAGAHRRSCLVRAFRRPRHLRPDPLHRWFARKAAAGIAPFSSLVPSTQDYLSGQPVETFNVPVEDRFNSTVDGHKTRRDLGLSEDLPVIGMVGKLAADRGFDMLIDAASKTATPCNVLVVGHGEHQQTLQARAEQLGISERVVWAGKREADLPEIYRSMDVVLFAAPGSDWGHRAISEAQACRRPVVAVDNQGVAELIDHEHTGLIVGRETRAIAEGIDRLLGDPAERKTMASAASTACRLRRLEPIGRDLARFLKGIGAAPVL